MTRPDYKATFGTPAAVLTDLTMDASEKREVLERWALDVSRRQDSANEGFILDAGGPVQPNETDELAEVTRALELLDGLNTRGESPTAHLS